MKTKQAGRSLLKWYLREGRTDLPWRKNTHPYRIWVSEIMLQQTRVEAVIPYYRRFLRKFPSVRILAAARLDAVLKAWEGLGYYTRARNLHRAAQIVHQQYGGRFPNSADDWKLLPGVGKYTSAAIASITKGQKEPVIDGNVRRVVSRLLMKEDGEESFLREAIKVGDAGDFNQAIMELGQVICTPRRPSCLLCPIQRHCKAFAEGAVDRFPLRKKKKEIPHHEIAIGVCRKGNRFLVSRRKEKGMLGGLWEFPGGKIRNREKPEKALVREFREEVGISIAVGKKFIVVPHKYSHFSIRLHTFHCSWKKGTPRALDCASVGWKTLEQMKKLAFPTANRKILLALTELSHGPDWSGRPWRRAIRR